MISNDRRALSDVTRGRLGLPSWNHVRAPLGATLSAILVTGSLALVMRHFRIGLSLTDSSCAEGFYRLTNIPIRRNELVAACLPPTAEREGLVRGYLRTGDCPGGAEPVLKLVGGLSGDQIEVAAGWVAVNGERLTNSATVAQDTAGRSLSHVVWGKRRVPGVRCGCSDLTIGAAGIPGISVLFRWD